MSLAKIKSLAEANEVDFECVRTGGAYSLECWAPQGQVWNATGTHFYALYGDGFRDKPDWSKTLADLRSAIEFGFEDCNDLDCDNCEN